MDKNMKEDKLKNLKVTNALLESLGINKVISNTLAKHNIVNETYVSEPKPFKQLSDNVSQKTKNGHMELYNDYIKSSNLISAELDATSKENANSLHSNYKSLKQDETFNLNAKILHELYFDNCFCPQGEIYMDSLTYMRLQQSFGTFENWQEDFIANAMSCGEGWAICGYNVFLKKFVNTSICGHDNHVMIGLQPLIVLDMWSHAYNRDYVIDKMSYIMVMMREFNWDIIETRFAIADKLGNVK